MKVRWFTLIEMLIVIVIIGILMTLSMWISWNRIQTLRTKSVQEQFVYNYNNLFSKNMLTNYYNWERYDYLIIHFQSWNNNLQYGYDTGWTIVRNNDFLQDGRYEIKDIKISWSNQTFESWNVILQPYILWCSIEVPGNTWQQMALKVLFNGMEENCFSINSSLCKLEKVGCD